MNKYSLDQTAQQRFITNFQSYQDSESSAKRLVEDSYSIRFNVSARDLTTMGVGGAASLIFESRHDLATISFVNYCNHHGIKYMYIGNGSNLVFPDNGIPEVVLIRLCSKLKYEFIKKDNQHCIVRVSAGSPLMGLSREMTNLGYAGLEFAAGIPGSVGGAIRMNAGAHGEEFGNVIRAVELLLPNEKVRTADTNSHWINSKELLFSYRTSSIPKNALILAVELELDKQDPAVTKSRRLKALNYRKLTQPLTMPSSGSVFKNPSRELSAGKLLEDLGFKGRAVGGLMFSELHANWIVRVNDTATTNDLRILVDFAKEAVLKKHNISLTEEIIFWESLDLLI